MHFSFSPLCLTTRRRFLAQQRSFQRKAFSRFRKTRQLHHTTISNTIVSKQHLSTSAPVLYSQMASEQERQVQEQQEASRPWIARFYGEERARDAKGRSLDDYKKFSTHELEGRHDYIQVLFPLPESSLFNFNAPIIDKQSREAFLQHEDLRESFFEAFKLMAHFYGFKSVYYDENGSPVIDLERFSTERALDSWLTPRDHNHLRITRIIRSLRVLGLEPVAKAFYQALLARSSIDKKGTLTTRTISVSKTTLMYWERAAKRPLHLPPDEDDENDEGIVWLREIE